jgi:hypothetical protein
MPEGKLKFYIPSLVDQRVQEFESLPKGKILTHDESLYYLLPPDAMCLDWVSQKVDPYDGKIGLLQCLGILDLFLPAASFDVYKGSGDVTSYDATSILFLTKILKQVNVIVKFPGMLEQYFIEHLENRKRKLVSFLQGALDKNLEVVVHFEAKGQEDEAD